MAAIIVKSEQLNLPEEIAKRFKGKELEIIEIKEGIRKVKDTFVLDACALIAILINDKHGGLYE